MATTTYRTPGVYVEEVDNLPMSVTGVNTTIPVFVGTTQKGPQNTPIVINTLAEYIEIFDKAEDQTFNVDIKGFKIVPEDLAEKIKEFNAEPSDIANQVKTFKDDHPDLLGDIEKYQDGHIFTTRFKDQKGADVFALVSVEVAEPSTINLYYQMQMFFANGGSTCYVMAIDKDHRDSSKPEDINAVLEPLATKDAITMMVLADIAANTNDEALYTQWCNQALAQCEELNRFLLMDVNYDGTQIEAFRKGISGPLDRGAAYTPYLNTTLNYIFSPESIIINDEDNLLDVGSSEDPSSSSSSTKVNASKSSSSSTTKANSSNSSSSSGSQVSSDEDASINLSDIKDTNNELYNQILAVVSQMQVEELPASGAMAGIYAKVDRQRGVWMAPANYSLNLVRSPSCAITARQQADLNVDPTTGKSINAIRDFAGEGPLVWGARTLDGNSNNWRYISVRRTISYVEDSITKALQAFVFESNNNLTWLKVSTMITTFLDDLWQQGGLAGSTAADAFFVNIGLGSTMTSQDILEGRMKISIGLAAVRPAEFIILEVTQLLQK